MIRTFFDSGVLITATRFQSRDADRALRFLEDPNRISLTSPFIHLEVVPKAIFFKNRLERLFYATYFANAVRCREIDKIEAAAQAEAAKTGFGVALGWLCGGFGWPCPGFLHSAFFLRLGAATFT